MISKALSYNQIALVPKCGIVSSRTECDTSVSFLGHRFAMPVIPANMRCSIDFEKAEWCNQNNIFYILHRFYPYDEIEQWMRSNFNSLISISVGVQMKDVDFVTKISKDPSIKVDFITIDIAHGYSLAMSQMISLIRQLNWRHGRPKIIAGNITSGLAAKALGEWGADAVKVGIGQGHVCTTRLETGFGMPMVTAIQEVKRSTLLPIIADGGLMYFGDAAKAISVGALMVMSGSMFARCIDSPAETEKPGLITGTYKRWYGSASEENKGANKYVEGKCVLEETNYLTYDELTQKWKEALQSAISYSGGNQLLDLRGVNFYEV